VQQIDSEIESKPLYLFEVKPVKLPRSRGDRGEWDQEKLEPTYIYYYLKNPSEEVDIQIFDQSGKLIKELQGTKDAGINLAVWDLAFEGGQVIGGGFVTSGNYVKPGIYSVKISSQEITVSGEIKVKSPYVN